MESSSSTYNSQFLDICSCNIVMIVYNFLSLILRSMQLQLQFPSNLCILACLSMVSAEENDADEHQYNYKPVKEAADNHEDIKTISREEVEEVLSSMKLLISHDDDEKQRIVANDILRIFDDEEPSLEEVKEAFGVFDQNNDGFVDAEELQAVLPMLGFADKQMNVQDCQEIIRKYDQNQDGKIDFVEFVRLLEISLL